MQCYEVAAAVAAVVISRTKHVSSYHRRQDVRKYARRRVATAPKAMSRAV
jgi:hypothetical protein